MKHFAYRVNQCYESSFDEPLVVCKGERLEFERRDSRWAGWIWCTSGSGKTGWVPESWVRIEGNSCVMKRDYSAVELTVREGEKLSTELIESGWIWVENSVGRSGWVPLDHLEPMSD
jgi:uncharacterized protein YgiM (DUF1202 family)